MNKRSKGNRFEAFAARYLEKAGFEVIERNYFCKLGEIDIIAVDGDTLVFVEVKYRGGNASGYPEEAVSYAKQKKICLAADYYRARHSISDGLNCRFDVIAVDSCGLRHYENAFMYVGKGY